MGMQPKALSFKGSDCRAGWHRLAPSPDRRTRGLRRHALGEACNTPACHKVENLCKLKRPRGRSSPWIALTGVHERANAQLPGRLRDSAHASLARVALSISIPCVRSFVGKHMQFDVARGAPLAVRQIPPSSLRFAPLAQRSHATTLLRLSYSRTRARFC